MRRVFGFDQVPVPDKKERVELRAKTFRWLARALGTLTIAPLALFGIPEAITDFAAFKSHSTIANDLTFAAFLMVIVGYIIGWFRDLPAAVLILGGSLLIFATALVFPGSLEQVYLFLIPAIPGFLFLYVYLASKKKKRLG